METYSKETSLRDYLRIIFKHKYLIILTVIPVMVINYIMLEFKTPFYKASVKMIVSGVKRTEATYYQPVRVDSFFEHAALVGSRQVLYPVVAALKLYERPGDDEKRYASPLKRRWIEFMEKKQGSNNKINDPDQLDPEMRKEVLINEAIGYLSNSVSVVPPDEMSNVFVISVRDFNPGRAAIIANSVSRSYVVFDLQRQVSELKLKYGEKYSTVVQIQSFIEELEKTLDGKLISNVDILLPASVKIIEQAMGAEEIGRENRVSTLVLALLGGLMLGVVFSLVIGFFDERFVSPIDLEMFLKIPVLGSIPKGKRGGNRLINDTERPTNYTNAFHDIAEKLYLLIKDKQLKSILVTDIGSSEELPLISANLAALISKKTDKSILIVDANLRTLGSMQDLNIPNTRGLAEVLDGKCNFEDVIYSIDGNISIVPSGNLNANPLNLIASNNMASLIKKVSEKYEIVFVICAGLNDYQDAVVMSSILDGVVLVINEETDRKPVVRFAINPMVQRKANIVGAILNNRSYVIPSIIYKLT